MSVIYSISFLLGCFVGFGRAIELYQFSKNKLQGKGNWEVIKLLLVISLPSLVLPFIFNSEINTFIKVIIAAACFSSGFSWIKIMSPVITETEAKLKPFQNMFKLEEPSEAKKSIINEIVEPFINPFRNVYRFFTLRKHALKEFNCKLYTLDDNFKKKFQSLCNSAGLKNVDLYMYETGIQPGFALLKPLFGKGNQCVCLSSYWYKELKPKEFTALIAHELMHIKNKDSGIRYRARSIIAIELLMMSMFGFAYITDLTIKFVPILGLIFLLIFVLSVVAFFFIFFYLLYDKHGFWSQLSEIRADRMCCKIEGVTKEGLIGLLRQIKVKDDKTFSNFTWYEKILVRYTGTHSHPSLDYRIKLIESYSEWSYKDYPKLMVSTLKWAITGKGWNGQ